MVLFKKCKGKNQPDEKQYNQENKNGWDNRQNPITNMHQTLYHPNYNRIICWLSV